MEYSPTSVFEFNYINLQIHSATLLQNDVLHVLVGLLLHLLKINSENKIITPNIVPTPIK